MERAMQEQVGVNPHNDLVRFLEEQDQLGLIASENPSIPNAVIYEPVIMTREEHITIEKGARIDSFVKLEGGERLHIGRYVHIASFAHLGIGGGTTIIEDYAAVASGGKIISGSNQVSGQSMSASAPSHLQRVKASITKLQRYSCVLTNAVVLPGVTLGEGAVLAAGAVASKDIPEWEIWGGVPARRLGYRLVDGLCPKHRENKAGSFHCNHCLLVASRQ